MPRVKVGGHDCKVSWAEYFAAILPKGTIIEWVKHPDMPKCLFDDTPQYGIGRVEFSFFYDGVSLHVDSGGKDVILYLGSTWPERIRRYRGPAILEYCI